MKCQDRRKYLIVAMVTCWGQWTISFVLGGWYRHNTFLKMFPSSANGLSYCTRINKPGPRFAFQNTMTVYICKPIACFFKSESVIGNKLMMNSSQSDCIYDTLTLFSCEKWTRITCGCRLKREYTHMSISIHALFFSKHLYD